MSPHDSLMNKKKPYESLANAIVCQAAEDYRTVCEVLKTKPYNHYFQREKEKLIEFFNSEWFTYLTNIEPVALLESLNKEQAIA